MPAEIIRPNLPHDQLTAAFVHETLSMPEGGTAMFANGTIANNKINAGYEEVSSSLRHRTMGPLSQMILQNQIKLGYIAPVPTGGNGWAHELSAELEMPDEPRIPVLEFEKLPNEKRKFTAPDITISKIKKLQEIYGDVAGIVLDDASSDGGTGETLADTLVNIHGLKIALIVSILFRGDSKLLVSKYRRGIVLAKHIPTMIDWNAYKKDGSLIGTAKS